MFAKLINKYNGILLENKGFVREEWFIGSALMAHDYKHLSEGTYFYEQDTIWTKVLELESINPYWEIFNQTDNVLLVNKSEDLVMSLLCDVFEELTARFKRALDMIIITSNNHMAAYLTDKGYKVILKSLPFWIGDEQVGQYMKVFVKNDGQFIPLMDCTEFEITSKSYFEININQFYLAMLDFMFYQQIPQKYLFFDDVFHLNLCESFFDFIDNQDNIRVVSLFDCLVRLSANEVAISSNYKGHTVKKLLKKFALYAIITELDMTKVYPLLRSDYSDFLQKELSKFTQTYPSLIQKYPRAILRDRYGITKAIYDYVTGNLVSARINRDIETVRYFTDIPFIETSLSMRDFEHVISKIIDTKRGGEGKDAKTTK